VTPAPSKVPAQPMANGDSLNSGKPKLGCRPADESHSAAFAPASHRGWGAPEAQRFAPGARDRTRHVAPAIEFRLEEATVRVRPVLKFRRNVVARSNGFHTRCQAFFKIAKIAAQAEIADCHRTIAPDKDVLGLKVAMVDIRSVSGSYRITNFSEHL
jgi:hypothetical protein